MPKKPSLFNLYLGKVPTLVLVHILIRYFTASLGRLEKYMPKSGHTLDFGCGYGIFSHLLCRASAPRKITGIDIDEKRIEIAKRTSSEGGSAVFAKKEAEAFGEKEFDAIVAIDVLYLVPRDEQLRLIKAFHKILKQNGILAIKTMDPRRRFKFLLISVQEFLAVKVFRITKSGDRRLHFIRDMARFKSVLHESGFSVREISLDRSYPYPHLLLLCRLLD